MTQLRYCVLGQTALSPMAAFYVWDSVTKDRVAGSINEHAAHTLVDALNEVERLKVAVVKAALPLEVMNIGINLCHGDDKRFTRELQDSIIAAVEEIRNAMTDDASLPPRRPNTRADLLIHRAARTIDKLLLYKPYPNDSDVRDAEALLPELRAHLKETAP